ncbi:MAG: ABC transporter permease [Desulfuromonas sp.]|nr:ABC transporter permease [Desulfuromonas sp.]
MTEQPPTTASTIEPLPPRHGAQVGQLEIVELDGVSVLHPSGDWTITHFKQLRTSIANLSARKTAHFDFSKLSSLDTAGAKLLLQLLATTELNEQELLSAGLSREHLALLQIVKQAIAAPDTTLQPTPWRISDSVAKLGTMVTAQWNNTVQLLNFTGLTLTTMARLLLQPRHWRLTSLFSHLQQTGLNAVPIVTLLTFLVGAVIAFLGATVLANFGVTIYTVNLVVFAFLREFGVLLAAILLAGRTASAFTAQIGSMKVNEEIDALRAQGFDPIDMLVVPRLLALLISLPLLTFIAMLAGIAGGAMVAVFSLDISLVRFMSIAHEVPVKHFLIGLGKAPIFAGVIALIGCVEGFKVEGTARSVGDHTTSSVVQSIFMVIVIDAIAALFFMEMGW